MSNGEIARQTPAANVIALSMYGEEEYYYRWLMPAKGFILKDSDISDVRDAIIASTVRKLLLAEIFTTLSGHQEQEQEKKLELSGGKEILLKICEALKT